MYEPVCHQLQQQVAMCVIKCVPYHQSKSSYALNLSDPQKPYSCRNYCTLFNNLHNIQLNTLLCMHAQTILILTLSAKSMDMVSYCYCVHTAVSAGYSMWYHITVYSIPLKPYFKGFCWGNLDLFCWINPFLPTHQMRDGKEILGHGKYQILPSEIL